MATKILTKKTRYNPGRRKFCISCAGVAGVALAAAGSIGWYARSLRWKDNVDVVIVGAGAAGIGAALALDEAGLSYVIVEADKRVGGRALTDTTSFVNSDGSAIPFDIGCAWIHNYNQKDKHGQPNNPMTKWVKELNFETYNDGDLKPAALFYGGTRRDDLLKKMEDDEGEIEDKIKHVAEVEKRDVPSSSVITDRCPPVDAAATYMGPMDTAADLEHVSTFDQADLAPYDPNYLVKKGYGTLVQAIASKIKTPVALGTPVTRIRYGGSHVLVDTAGYNPGTITAKAVIVTVSTGVMNSGAIKFTPELPIAHQAAFAEVPMGLLTKIPLLVPNGMHEANSPKPYDNILVERPHRQNDPCIPGEHPGPQDIFFLAWPWDSDLMVGFVGGDFAWELSAAGERAAVDFATQRLGDIFGSDMSKKVKKGLLTPWASNPLTLGAYAVAMPGDYESRDIMRQPVNGRVFFAGEALTPAADGMYGTCSGAYASGTNVAGDVVYALKQPTKRS